MACVIENEERQIEKCLLTFRLGNAVLVPDFFGIALVLLE